MDEDTVSPLASFPSENPQNIASPSRPWYSSQIFLYSILFVILGVGIIAASIVLNTEPEKSKDNILTKKQTATPTPKQTKDVLKKITPSAITAGWQTYKNVSYAYDIQYAKEVTPKEMDTREYGYTDLANGCMKIYAVHQSVVPTLSEEKNGIPWKQLEDLKSMPVGQSRNCSVLMFTFGEDGAAVVDKNDYAKQTSVDINGSEWYTFAVKNGASTGVDTHTVYLTEKKNTTYVIETKTGGSCPTTPTDMLSTFSFTK